MDQYKDFLCFYVSSEYFYIVSLQSFNFFCDRCYVVKIFRLVRAISILVTIISGRFTIPYQRSEASGIK